MFSRPKTNTASGQTADRDIPQINGVRSNNKAMWIIFIVAAMILAGFTLSAILPKVLARMNPDSKEQAKAAAASKDVKAGGKVNVVHILDDDASAPAGAPATDSQASTPTASATSTAPLSKFGLSDPGTDNLKIGKIDIKDKGGQAPAGHSGTGDTGDDTQTNADAPLPGHRTSRNEASAPEDDWKKRKLQGWNEKSDSPSAQAAALTAALSGANTGQAQGGIQQASYSPTQSYGGGSATGDDGTLDSRLRAATPAESGRLDPSRTLPVGSVIDCNLESAIASSLPGTIRCSLPFNVYTADGSHIVAEKGSIVTGEYNARLKVGDTRLFVIWERIRRFNGKTVAINSPGTDQLGRSGLSGEVDTRFWQRLGSALLVSIVADGVAKADPRNEAGATTQTTQAVVGDTVKDSINLPPVIRIRHGDPIQISIRQDIRVD